MPGTARAQFGQGLVLLALGIAVAVTGALASLSAREFYALLVKPDWAPPGWVFGPVWTTLYLLMTLAAWLVLRQGGWRQQARAMTWYGVQLLLNALWSWLFFAWHLGYAAIIDVLLLWVAIAITLRHFARVQPVAGWLLVPYLLWVTLAMALNIAVVRLNPTLW